MGMFDSVWLKCPKCGTENEFQSKSGPCCLGSYTADNVPADVVLDINRHAPTACTKCGTLYEAIVNTAVVAHVATREVT